MGATMRRWLIVSALAIVIAGTGACGHSRTTGGGASPSPKSATTPALDCAADAPSPSDSTVPPSLPPTTDPSYGVMQAQLDDLATKASAVGTGFPDSFAGVALDQDHGRLLVYRVPSPKFDQAIGQQLTGAPYLLVDAAHSARQLHSVADRVRADRDYWQAHGVAVNSISPLADGSCVEVGTDSPATAKAPFAQRYGATAPIRLVHAEPVSPADDHFESRPRSGPARSGPDSYYLL
jgi:hypothetical protein